MSNRTDNYLYASQPYNYIIVCDKNTLDIVSIKNVVEYRLSYGVDKLGANNQLTFRTALSEGIIEVGSYVMLNGNPKWVGKIMEYDVDIAKQSIIYKGLSLIGVLSHIYPFMKPADFEFYVFDSATTRNAGWTSNFFADVVTALGGESNLNYNTVISGINESLSYKGFPCEIKLCNFGLDMVVPDSDQLLNYWKNYAVTGVTQKCEHAIAAYYYWQKGANQSSITYYNGANGLVSTSYISDNVGSITAKKYQVSITPDMTLLDTIEKLINYTSDTAYIQATLEGHKIVISLYPNFYLKRDMITLNGESYIHQNAYPNIASQYNENSDDITIWHGKRYAGRTFSDDTVDFVEEGYDERADLWMLTAGNDWNSIFAEIADINASSQKITHSQPIVMQGQRDKPDDVVEYAENRDRFIDTEIGKVYTIKELMLPWEGSNYVLYQQEIIATKNGNKEKNSFVPSDIFFIR